MNRKRTAHTSKFHTGQLTLIGLMTAVLCVISPFSIPLPFSPVPFSLGTMAIYFIALILGPKSGTISVLLYLLLGAVGLPVFSGFTGGPGKLFGPTGGYLLGYVVLTFVCGLFVQKSHRKVMTLLGMLLGTFFCYTLGSIWLACQLSLTIKEALAIGVLPYLPGDIAKIALALILGTTLRTRLKKSGMLC